jgi:hypothetical protein
LTSFAALDHVKIGTGGSFPLYMYMTSVLFMTPTFTPTDVDLYLFCPEYCTFNRARRQFVQILRDCGVAYKGRSKYPRKTSYHDFKESSEPFYIMDYIIYLDGKQFVVSLIWHIEAFNMDEIVQSYDLDIVKVQMNFSNEDGPSFKLSHMVSQNILHMTAHVTRHFCLSDLSDAQIGNLCSTLNHMQKYRNRSFRICNFPSFTFHGDILLPPVVD